MGSKILLGKIILPLTVQILLHGTLSLNTIAGAIFLYMLVIRI
jgi:hypothetical protein